MRTTVMIRTDEDLVAASRAGDRQAFEVLVRRHARAAARLAGRLLGNREDAEDVVQESFTRAFLGIRSFRGDSTFKTWVLHITLHQAQDLLRRRSRRGGSESDAVLDSARVASAAAGPARRIAARDEVEVLSEALDQLPARQKTALLLKVYEGFSYEEVAAVLSTTVGAARVYLSLARRSLRRRFERTEESRGRRR